MVKPSPTHHKIAVTIPIDVYNRIKLRAYAEGISFSTCAAALIACGLLDYEESEAHEPQAEPQAKRQA